MRNSIINSFKNQELKRNNSFHFISRNANEYWHLLNGKYHAFEPEINWSSHLREYPKMKPFQKSKILFKTHYIHPPKFYYEDEKKFKEKKSNSPKLTNKIFNYYSYKHLFSKKLNGGTVSQNIIDFVTNLRKFKSKKDNIIKHDKIWNNTTRDNILLSTNYLPISERLNENLIIRPYNILRKEASCGDLIIKQRTFIKDKKFAFNWFGLHNSEPSYINFYRNKSFAELEKCLRGKKKSRLQCFFQLNLRNQIKKKN